MRELDGASADFTELVIGCIEANADYSVGGPLVERFGIEPFPDFSAK